MNASLRAIAWNDWPTLACLIGIPMMWGLYIVFPILRPSASVDGYFLMVPLVSTSLLSAVVLWRAFRIQGLFRHGAEVPGRVRSVRLVRDRGRFEYAYAWNDQVLESWIPVHKIRRVLAFTAGEAVTVLVDPKKPGRSVVRELFS